MMRIGLTFLVLFSVGCAHLDRAQAESVNRFDVATDAEIARYAVLEALGQLNEVEAVDPETGHATGHAAFASREERLSFDARVHRLFQQRTYGQGPTVQLVRVRCETLARTGWAAWPADAARADQACTPGDVTSIHSLYRKAAMQRAYVEGLLEVVDDAGFARQTRETLTRIQQGRIEPYVIVVEAWEQLDGFRPRG